MPVLLAHKAEDLHWLREHHNEVTLTAAADRMGVCVDTLKRLLVKEGLRDFPGAKYQVARQRELLTWERPCISCGSREVRPKNWFFCRPCRSSRGYDDE